MCNLACLRFIQRALNPEEINGKMVLESGSRDVNGSARGWVTAHNPARYLGTDIQGGLGVDMLCAAEHLVETLGPRQYDIVISTEVLEHVANWQAVISNYKRVLRPGGILLITTRSKGFPYHGYPEDHWRYEIGDMQVIFGDLEILMLESDPDDPGVFLKARKPKTFKELNLKSYPLGAIRQEIVTMRGDAYLSKITGVPGWETDAEQEYLYTLAMGLSEEAVILEIGGEYGMSASLFAKGSPTARIYSVDIRYAEGLGEIHAGNLQEAGVGTNVTRIAGDSQIKGTVAKFRKLEKEMIDLLFIDGAHDYQGALNDLNLWTPLTKIGSFLVLHDTAGQANRQPHVMHFDVSRALAIWYEGHGSDWAVAANIDTITSFKRIK